jgi:hypothetical protein
MPAINWPLRQGEAKASQVVQYRPLLSTQYTSAHLQRFNSAGFEHLLRSRRHVSGLAETRLARSALRSRVPRLLNRGCSSVEEHPEIREVGGSIPFSFSSD